MAGIKPGQMQCIKRLRGKGWEEIREGFMKEVTTEPTVDLKLQERFGYVMMGYKVHQTGGGAGGEDAGGNFA